MSACEKQPLFSRSTNILAIQFRYGAAAMAVPATPSRTNRTPASYSSRFNRTPSRTNSDVVTSQHNAAVVIEIGSVHTRIGLAGESSPRHVIDTPELPFPYAGRPSSFTATCEKKWEEKLYPLFSYILTDLLLIKPRLRRVLVIEPFVSPTAFRTALCRVLLLWLNVPSILFVPGGMVSVPYALGVCIFYLFCLFCIARFLFLTTYLSCVHTSIQLLFFTK